MSNVRLESMTEKQNRLFRQFIQGKRVLVVDSQSYSRAALAQTLVDLGTSMSKIELVTTYEQAEQAIAREFPDIIIAEFDLEGGRCGLDLLLDQRKSNTKSKKSLFFLVTGNNSQAAVARAAEEDVDGYLLKPYTIDGLRNSIMRYVILKVYPSNYTKVIEEGKTRLAEKKIEEALTTFEKAMGLDPKPSLAHFYHGQAELMKKTLSNAETDYDKGLSFNKIHYKCLVGLFELFMEQKRNKEAYDVVRKISRYFPANPDRLASVLRLAVINNAFEDIERYYQLFCKLDHRKEELIRYVCAALTVCGKYYLQTKQPIRAIELFNKAKATGARNPRVLKEIINSLVEYDHAVEAAEFLKAYPPRFQSTPEFATLQYLVEEHKMSLGMSVSKGRELLQQGISDPIFFLVLIERHAQAGYQDQAEELHQAACQQWPEKKEQFDRMLKEPRRRVG